MTGKYDKRSIMRSLSILISSMLFLVAAPAFSQDEAPTPRKIIEEAISGITTVVIDSATDEEMRRKARDVMEKFVDFEAFGKLCLAKRWKTLTGEQQKLYLSEFKTLLQKTYLRRFKRGQQFTVEFRGDTRFSKRGDRAEVKTELTSVDVGADVDYRFHKRKEGSWKVYDIVVDDVSVMRNYRRAFTRVLKKEGFPALIEKMQKRDSEELDEPLVEEPPRLQ